MTLKGLGIFLDQTKAERKDRTFHGRRFFNLSSALVSSSKACHTERRKTWRKKRQMKILLAGWRGGGGANSNDGKKCNLPYPDLYEKKNISHIFASFCEYFLNFLYLSLSSAFLCLLPIPSFGLTLYVLDNLVNRQL